MMIIPFRSSDRLVVFGVLGAFVVFGLAGYGWRSQEIGTRERVATAAAEEAARRWEVPKVFPNGFKLQVEHPNNTDFLKYHVSVRVTPSTFEDIGTLISDTESPNRGLLRDLSEVNGVGKVILRPYEVIIEKGQMFDWHEMQPALETVIRQHLEPRVPVEK